MPHYFFLSENFPHYSAAILLTKENIVDFDLGIVDSCLTWGLFIVPMFKLLLKGV